VVTVAVVKVRYDVEHCGELMPVVVTDVVFLNGIFQAVMTVEVLIITDALDYSCLPSGDIPDDERPDDDLLIVFDDVDGDNCSVDMPVITYPPGHSRLLWRW